MKKILLLIAFLVLPQLALAAGSTILSYNHLYRGSRSLGMGGAYTAVGGNAEAVFYNPATLTDMGFQLRIVDPLVEIDQNAIDISKDVSDTMALTDTTQRVKKMTDLIDKNMGKALHARVAVFPSVAVRNVVVGVLGQGTTDARLHNPLSSSGAVEVVAGAEYGPVAGFSVGLPVPGLRLGAAGKFLSRTSVAEAFTVQQLTDTSFKYDDLYKTNSDFSADLGLLYEVPVATVLKPRIGASMLDITDLDFKEGGKIPSRINLGASLIAKLPLLAEVIVAADYEDFTKKFEQDKSLWKRIHVGAEGSILNRHLTVRAGLNQGYPSYGAAFDLWVLKVAYTYYTEELGAYAGQEKDNRHVFHVALGW